MAHTAAHANTHACRGISGGLTFGLSPSMLSCISCDTVWSRILFSSACCRRSFISSRVSSSGCKGRRRGGMYRHNETGTHRRGSGRGKEKTHQDRRFRRIRLPRGEQLLHLGTEFSCSSAPWDYPRCYRCQQHAKSTHPLETEEQFSIYFRIQFTLYQLHEDIACSRLWHKFLIWLRELWVTGFLSLHWCEASQRSSWSEQTLNPTTWNMHLSSAQVCLLIFCHNVFLEGNEGHKEADKEGRRCYENRLVAQRKSN